MVFPPSLVTVPLYDVCACLLGLACEEAREINKNRRKVLEEKEAARQNSKFYTKIKVLHLGAVLCWEGRVVVSVSGGCGALALYL